MPYNVVASLVRQCYGMTLVTNNVGKTNYAFEMWCLGQAMRVSWMEKKSNTWVLENINIEWTPE